MDEADITGDRLAFEEEVRRKQREVREAAKKHYDYCDCGEFIGEGRGALGYPTCIECAEALERLQKLYPGASTGWGARMTLVDIEAWADPCHCGAYPFPHRAGGGKCKGPGEWVCTACGHVTEPVEVDFGIGPYEHFGTCGMHKDVRTVSKCCESDLKENQA